MISSPRFLSVTLLLLAGACSSSSGGSGSSTGDGELTGTVHGQPITISDAISASVSATVDGNTVHEAVIFMANENDLCTEAMTSTEHPDEMGSFIFLTDVNGTTLNTPTAPGTYTIFQSSGTPAAKSATFNVVVDDATCNDITAQEASGMSGTVTLSSVSGNQFSGSFDIVLDSGDHVTGNFDPGECPALNTVINSMTTTSTCK